MPALARTRSLSPPAGAFALMLALAVVAALPALSLAAAPASPGGSDHNAHTFTNPVARRW